MRLLCGIYEDGLSLPEMVSGNRLCGRRLICNTHLSPKCYDLLCFSNSMMERPFVSQYCGKNPNTRPWTCTSKQVVKSCCHEYHLCSATHNSHRSFVSFLWLLIFTLSLWIVWLLVFHDPSRKFILPIPIPGGEVSSYYWLRFTVHSIHMFITFSSRAFWLKQK